MLGIAERPPSLSGAFSANGRFGQMSGPTGTIPVSPKNGWERWPVGRLQGDNIAAYTALMHHSFPTIKHLTCSSLIILSGFLMTSCCTPGSYHYQPVTYMQQNPYYTPTYSYQSYPVYQSVVIPTPAPRYAWNTPCPPPPPCHRGEDWQGYHHRGESWAYDGRSREGYRASVRQQSQQAYVGSTADRNTSSHPYQTPQEPAPAAAIQQQPSLANNQFQSGR